MIFITIFTLSLTLIYLTYAFYKANYNKSLEVKEANERAHKAIKRLDAYRAKNTEAKTTEATQTEKDIKQIMDYMRVDRARAIEILTSNT